MAAKSALGLLIALGSFFEITFASANLSELQIVRGKVWMLSENSVSLIDASHVIWTFPKHYLKFAPHAGDWIRVQVPAKEVTSRLQK